MSCPGSLPGVWFCGYENVARCSAGPDQKTFNLPSGYFADFRNSTPTATGTIPARTTVLSTTTVFASNSSPVITSYPTSDPASISNSSHQLCTADIATQTRIGVGVGLPLGISLIGAVILLFRERNMRRKTERSELTSKHLHQRFSDVTYRGLIGEKYRRKAVAFESRRARSDATPSGSRLHSQGDAF